MYLCPCQPFTVTANQTQPLGNNSFSWFHKSLQKVHVPPIIAPLKIRHISHPLPNTTHLKFRHVYSNSVHPQKHNKSTAHKRRKHALLVPHGHNKNKPRIVASQTRFRRKQTHKPLLTISDFSETLKPYPSLSVSLQIHFQWEILFLVLRNWNPRRRFHSHQVVDSTHLNKNSSLTTSRTKTVTRTRTRMRIFPTATIWSGSWTFSITTHLSYRTIRAFRTVSEEGKGTGTVTVARVVVELGAEGKRRTGIGRETERWETWWDHVGGSRWGPERASFSIWGSHLRLRSGPVGFCMSMLLLIILR